MAQGTKALTKTENDKYIRAAQRFHKEDERFHKEDERNNGEMKNVETCLEFQPKLFFLGQGPSRKSYVVDNLDVA